MNHFSKLRNHFFSRRAVTLRTNGFENFTIEIGHTIIIVSFFHFDQKSKRQTWYCSCPLPLILHKPFYFNPFLPICRINSKNQIAKKVRPFYYYVSNCQKLLRVLVCIQGSVSLRSRCFGNGAQFVELSLIGAIKGF